MKSDPAIITAEEGKMMNDYPTTIDQIEKILLALWQVPLWRIFMVTGSVVTVVFSAVYFIYLLKKGFAHHRFDEKKGKNDD